jgi:hypothetical protein
MNGLRILAAAAAAALAPSAAEARIYYVGPDACARAADAAPYETPLDAIADDLNQGHNALEGVSVFYAAPNRGWASRRLAARFLILIPVDKRAGEASILACKRD